MKRLVILFLILVLVGGGAALYLLFFSRGATVPEILESINPFGTPSQNDIEQNSFPTTGERGNVLLGGQAGVQGFSLLQISTEPATGYTFMQKEIRRIIDDEEIVRNEFVVRFQERNTGHVTDVSLNTRESVKVSNTTMTQVQQASFISGGNAFISQRIDGTDIIRTGLHVFETSDDTGETRLVSQVLENNLIQAVPAPSLQKIFVSRVENGQYQGIVTNPDGTNGKVIFESPITEWWGSWINDTQILIVSKPGNSYPGGAYAITISTNAKRPIVTRVPGLEVTPSQTGTTFMYSGATSGGVKAGIITSAGADIPIQNTLADKCVWTKDGKTIYCAVPTAFPRTQYPDAWHQGKVSFADGMFEIDGITGAVRRSFSLETNGSTIDAVRLSLSTDETVLGFMNKRDNTVWVLNVAQATTTTATNN